MKELYLDTANIGEISEMLRTDAIQGVTTNPSLMAKEQKGSYTQKLDDICQMFQAYSTGRKHLSVEVISLDPKIMYQQAFTLKEALGKYDKVQLHIKIPVMLETLEVISKLSDNGIKVNATACMTALQAKLAHDAGAPIISFFYNRMIDGGVDADLELQRFAELNRNARVICGSIRKPDDLRRCWLSGADIVTASMKVIKETITHPKTDEAISQFQKDIDAWLK
jgi:transaldolase